MQRPRGFDAFWEVQSAKACWRQRDELGAEVGGSQGRKGHVCDASAQQNQQVLLKVSTDYSGGWLSLLRFATLSGLICKVGITRART